ncbi:TPA: nucleotide sugar dehydrogenase [Legionella pneumophila]|uniref:Nucleotide sugar dehydrogenase n=1 Tax=Legionella pneumophila TaxID=446 RepID=A0AAP8XVH0_LEGPN|nr:nucleotide sugar dehydrogenase [Legionella pneumophila]HCC3251343.1 nucleotide sugar dehydrogenase [Legionella pneumophila subsp. pneumophila]AMV15218.1 UDP-N-acetyl-D-glucosamine 6-dehydrogenase [Legionella pneumophila]MBN5929859.1 nucleotide sugar dehydrogenase [Legionella pneumophila]PYB44016.1 nucleotide sugar dehydrogenase [Legionella pneumophila]PYB49869.1 nucleotide sugar dehydrogenase [Legionella pneumophila]
MHAHQRIISVIGLGYVGLTTAVAFSHESKVIAFDNSKKRISELKNGNDRNDEISDIQLTSKNICFTSQPSDLQEADFYIVTVPTPLDSNKQPDLSILLSVSIILGQYLKPGDIVVYESTVFPGATEQECIPLLETTSQLICGKDFNVGYSPERINPADKQHTFQNVVKIISATSELTLDIMSRVYGSVITAGVHPVSSIRIAEACKVIENTQRDVNIALINDLSRMLHAMGMEAHEVVAAMKTKWNYLPFEPGLVGGHCIGVNSYYLMHKAEEIGYHSEIISASRRMNESMAKFIVNETIRNLVHIDVLIKKCRVAILGLTYKENCSDIRDTRVIDIIKELQSYEVDVLVHDPIADKKTTQNEYGIELVDWNCLTNLDAILITVAHKKYLRLSKQEILDILNARGLIMDIKNIINLVAFSDTDITVWRL